MFRKLVSWVLSGALLGLIVTSLIAPRYYAWYNAPAVGNALCDCVTVTRQVAAQMLNAQMIGSAIGAVLFLVLGILFERGRKSRSTPAPGISSAAPPPSMP
ncbi:MAG: hypothetical protein K1X64_20865 [Myxococcaceae bacterium]|nr:hypothetical protein [Myxococcaceae bacterium]